jgi:hypothetical protein
MLNQIDVPAFIARQLPQVRQDIYCTNAPATAYRSIQVLTDFTKRMALEHEFKLVGKCMDLMEKIYDKGNAIVRNAVENVFIFSFSTLMCNCNVIEWRLIQSCMPAGLYSLYVRQVLRSNC